MQEFREYVSLFLRKMRCKKNVRSEVEKIYNANFNNPLDLKNPVLLTEKLQYLKLNEYYNNPIITKCVDKYAIKDYIKKEKNNICKTAELYGVYNSVREIKWDELPNQFVLKCNHGCGFNIICLDKERLNVLEVCKTLNKWMKTDYWTIFAEPQYMNVEKRIIAEEFLGEEIFTYTYWCFNGEVKVINIQSKSDSGELFIDYFDTNWNWLNVTSGTHGHNPNMASKPVQLDNMIKIAKHLAAEFPFVRVDLYLLGSEIYLSELTFIPGGGYFQLYPENVDKEWGQWLRIKKNNHEKALFQ